MCVQVCVGLRTVMMRVMGSHVCQCVCGWASEGISMCISMRTCMWVAVGMQDCIWMGVWAGTAAVRCLSVPIGGAAVAGGVVLRKLGLF